MKFSNMIIPVSKRETQQMRVEICKTEVNLLQNQGLEF